MFTKIKLAYFVPSTKPKILDIKLWLSQIKFRISNGGKRIKQVSDLSFKQKTIYPYFFRFHLYEIKVLDSKLPIAYLFHRIMIQNTAFNLQSCASIIIIGIRSKQNTKLKIKKKQSKSVTSIPNLNLNSKELTLVIKIKRSITVTVE